MTLCSHVVHNSKLQHFVGGTNCVIVVWQTEWQLNLHALQRLVQIDMQLVWCRTWDTHCTINCTAKHVTICAVWSLEG